MLQDHVVLEFVTEIDSLVRLKTRHADVHALAVLQGDPYCRQLKLLWGKIYWEINKIEYSTTHLNTVEYNKLGNSKV